MATLLLSLLVTLFIWTSEASTKLTYAPPCRLVQCLINPCEVETCPRFPKAVCRPNFCGGCNAVFFNEKGAVIPKFACPADNKWPECLASAGCPALGNRCQTGCPSVRDAVCSQNCDCSTVFTDRRTGKVLGSDDCFPKVYDKRCPLVKRIPSIIKPDYCPTCPITCPEGTICCLAARCGSTCVPIPEPKVCPSLPIHRNYNVRCSKGSNVGSVCWLSCPKGQRLDGVSKVQCHENGNWSPNLSRTRCVDERCPVVIRPSKEIPICSRCPKTCPPGQICCPAACGSRCHPISEPKVCPSLPIHGGNYNARCTKGSNVGSVCWLSCPKGQRLEGISKVQCHENGNWSPNLSRTRCVDERCPVVIRPSKEIPICSRCPKTCPPGQICCPAACGSRCHPISEPKVCPSLPIHGDYNVRCSKGSNVGSVCWLSCPKGQRLEGVSKVQCHENGNWSPNLSRTRCVDERCPIVIRPSKEIPLCSRCPKTCPPGQICCPAACGSRCHPISEPKVCPSLPIHGGNYNARCTKGSNVGSVCWLSCPKGQRLDGVSKVRCHENGNWSPNLSRTRCVDERCPVVIRPSKEIPLCSICPKTCPPGQICCPATCGSRCHPISVNNCPPPFHPKARVSFQLSCTNEYQVGSRCDVVCPEGRVLIGTSQIQCLPSRRWNQRLGKTQCVPKNVCPPGTPVARCFASPCKSAKCPGVPEATCVDNFCGGCNFDFFVNGRKLSKKECIPRKPCTLRRARTSRCRNPCYGAKCPTNPDAICKPDCFCVARFYSSTTFEEVMCKKGDKPAKE